MNRDPEKPSGRPAQPQRVTVEFTVSVLCQVDLGTGRVERVRILDEEISEPGPVYAPDGSPAPGPAARQARELSLSRPWPSWEFGG